MAFRTNHILSHNSRYPLPLSPLDVDMKSTLASDPNSYSRPADFTTSSRLHKGVMYYGQGDMKEAIPLEIFRWLLVVTPPDILGAEGGKTLSSDVLMTLQHTLPNQLDAVAKEFGLPSTVGLRVFVHLTVEAGVPPVRPRVTDDVWPLLWAQYLHSNQHPSLTQLAGLPIAGHVEFDIDMQSARWYNTWRRHGDLSGAISSSHPVDTKIGFVPLDASNHFNEAHAKSRSSKTHIRHLSLLERRGEISRLHNSSRTNTLSGTNGFVVDAKEVQEVAYPKILPGHVPISPHVRSLVQEWRKRTPMGVVPHPEVPLGAPFVEADADVSEHMDDGILDLDDFPWSISSAGPPSYDGNDLMTLSPLPRSVHMADRRAGSVMTPSTATSFGSPIDGHASSTYPPEIRLPTPIASRMIDDSPCTPSIVATRSPPLDGDHNSPVISSVLEQSDPTFDLADRSFHPAFPLETMAANASRAVVQPVSVYSSEYLHNLDETYLGLKSEVGHSDHPSVPQNNHQELSLFPVETERSSTASKSLNKLREESSSWLPTFYPLMDSHPRMYHYNLGSIDPSRYPSFNLCPTFRPHSSASIFPGRAWVCENSFTSDAPDPFRYPFIVIYPTVYPWIEPYPVIAGHPSPEPAPATWRCMQETHSNIHRPTLPNSSEPEVSEEDGPFLSPASASTTDTPLEVQIGIFDRSILTMTFTPDVLDLVTGIMNEAVSGGRDGEFHEVDAPSGFSELGAGVRFPAGGFSLAGQRDLEINSMSKNGQCTPSEYSDDGHQRRFQSVTRAAASISSFKAESPFPQDVPPGSSPHFDGPYDEDDEGDEEAPCLEQLRCTVTSSI